jgi:hypothetical protein
MTLISEGEDGPAHRRDGDAASYEAEKKKGAA